MFNKEYSRGSILGNMMRGEGSTVLCGGEVDVSGRRDSDGNTSVEAKVSTSTETEKGIFSAEVRGSVNKDKEKNSSAEVEGSITWRW